MIVKLHPTSAWRIGPDSGDRDRVDRIYHSDSLYSAVTNAAARLGFLEEWLDATVLQNNSARPDAEDPVKLDSRERVKPAVRFSSCFPFVGETLFVTPPRSVWPPPASSKVRWKGAKFVPMAAVSELIRSRTISEDGWAVDPASECLLPMSGQGSASGPFRVAVRSNAAIDRWGEAVAAHSTACMEFAPNAGLWAMAEFADDEAREKWKARLEGAIRLLGDSGFGGERSRGWGRAEVSFSEEKLGIPAAEDAEVAWWMLSLFHPAEDDAIDWKRGNYSLTTRGGRVENSGEEKKSTRMIAEGSVVYAASEPRGSAPNVAPEEFGHAVYRAGFALALPIPVRVTT